MQNGSVCKSGNTGSGDGSCKKEEAGAVGDSGRFEE